MHSPVKQVNLVPVITSQTGGALDVSHLLGNDPTQHICIQQLCTPKTKSLWASIFDLSHKGCANSAKQTQLPGTYTHKPKAKCVQSNFARNLRSLNENFIWPSNCYQDVGWNPCKGQPHIIWRGTINCVRWQLKIKQWCSPYQPLIWSTQKWQGQFKCSPTEKSLWTGRTVQKIESCSGYRWINTCIYRGFWGKVRVPLNPTLWHLLGRVPFRGNPYRLANTLSPKTIVLHVGNHIYAFV